MSDAGPLRGALTVWPAETIWQEVVSFLPGFTVEVLPAIDSTNSELMRRARAGSLDPVLLVAEQQTAGRGRLGRTWHSGATGSLTFSLALPLAPQDWSGLSLAVGVSVARSLHPSLRLKWPNDIWLEDRKLAGILIETASVGEKRLAVIGIGINIRARAGDGLFTAPACLQELLPEVGAPAALLRVVPALIQAVSLFEAQGFAPFQAAFKERDLLRGRTVVLSDGTSGEAAGVNGTGALLVHTSAGMQAITSAEVSVRPVGA
jgi:BirA family biotin operon repressor/biotin-[acetyl-CoA-carboxylase] ligase